MLRDRLQRNPAEIVIVHPGDEITKHIRGHVPTKRGESLLEVFAVEGGHGGVSISQDRSLCAIWADSIMPRRQAGETGRQISFNDVVLRRSWGRKRKNGH